MSWLFSVRTVSVLIANHLSPQQKRKQSISVHLLGCCLFDICSPWGPLWLARTLGIPLWCQISVLYCLHVRKICFHPVKYISLPYLPRFKECLIQQMFWHQFLTKKIAPFGLRDYSKERTCKDPLSRTWIFFQRTMTASILHNMR